MTKRSIINASRADIGHGNKDSLPLTPTQWTGDTVMTVPEGFTDLK